MSSPNELECFAASLINFFCFCLNRGYWKGHHKLSNQNQRVCLQFNAVDVDNNYDAYFRHNVNSVLGDLASDIY